MPNTHLLSDDREKVLEKLKAANIPTAVHYPIPLNRQPALQTDEFSLKVAERLSEKVFSLPMHPYLTIEDQDRIVSALG